MLKQKENIMGTVIICGAVAVLMVILVVYTVKRWKTQKCPSADGHFCVVLHAALKGLAVSTLFLSRIGLVGTDGDVV